MTIYPRIGTAFGRLSFVIKPKIPEDLGMHRISGGDLCAAVEETPSLIKIHRPLHVRGDDLIVLPVFGNTIDLYSQEYRNLFLLQLARKHNRRGCAPAVAIKNDARTPPFFLRKAAVAVGIQPLQDRAMRSVGLSIFEDLRVQTGHVDLPEFLHQLDFRVACVITVDESANEANHDRGRCNTGGGRGSWQAIR